MSQPLSDYFAQEAGEYLDQLDALLAAPETPDPVRFFRLARGVRGSAQIAGVAGVAAVAERLEEAGRSLRDGVLPWSDEVRRRARETVDDLRALVAGAARWGQAEEARARQAVARWDDAGVGKRRTEVGGEAPDRLLAFLRREIGGVVSELNRSLGELAAAPDAREPLRAVLRRMRPVRGVAGMDTLSPVLELLEGIEDVAHEVLSRSGAAEARQLELLRAGRDALASVGAALERGGTVDGTPELDRFRELRDGEEGDEGPAAEAGVVPVSRLFFDDGGPRVVSSPLAPVGEEGAAGTLAADVESFLRIEATGFLDRAEALISGLSGRPQRFGRTARQLAGLAAGVGDLAVTYGLAQIAAAAEEAAARLARAAAPEEARAVLTALRSSLPGGAPAEAASAPAPSTSPSTAPAPAPAADAAPTDVHPSAAAAKPDEEEGVVPVETLFFDPDGALREALRLRPRIEALAGSGAQGGPLGEALDELFALLETGLAGRAA